MKRWKWIMVLGSASIMACMPGCSKVAKEKDIQEDLESFTKSQFLADGEKIDDISIEKRTTDKKGKSDIVWCTVTTEKGNVSYEKGVELIYHLYDQGWSLDDYVVDESGEWKLKPLKGITVDSISESLVGEKLEVDGEEWKIEDGEIAGVSIEKQKTDLEKEKDTVQVKIDLEGDVEKVTGTINAEYKFDKEWKLVTLSEKDKLKSEVIEKNALNIDETKLIQELTNYTISCGNDAHPMKQNITITEDEVTDFKIDKQESRLKGTEQDIECSCTLKKKDVTLGLKINTSCIYEGEWLQQAMNIESEVKEVDLQGKWSGRYSAVGIEGDVVLDITNVDQDSVTATYTYTPDKITKYSQAGSYNVSGEFDIQTLNLNLKAGEWIEEPQNGTSAKQDIKAAVNADMGIIEGTGQNGNVFRVEKQ